ncbi:MAG: allophanate hydrolase subunit 1, partial [Acidobacteria bacterium]|nr:allophanate hydrolase subunit 1 [Acidobacteriota bacterium]
MSGKGEPLVRNAGEAAFSVEFGDEISIELNERATAFAALLEREPFEGFREAIPTFRSVLVFHDPEADPEAIRADALDLARRAGREPARPPRRIEFPCVYDGEDLPDVAAQIGVSVEELIRIHSERDYRVFIIGFTPGFPYLGMADPRLDIPRRSVPRV